MSMSDFADIIGRKNVDEVKAKVERQLSLGDLKQLKIVGIRSFAKVWVVEDKLQNHFALKVIEKKMVLQSKAMDALLNEKNTLAALAGTHPFIVNSYGTLQDMRSVMFVLQFVPGGELTRRRRRERRGRGMERRRLDLLSLRRRINCCRVGVSVGDA